MTIGYPAWFIAAFLSPMEAECLVWADIGRRKAAKRRHDERKTEDEKLQRRQQERQALTAFEENAGQILAAALDGFEVVEAA